MCSAFVNRTKFLIPTNVCGKDSSFFPNSNRTTVLFSSRKKVTQKIIKFLNSYILLFIWLVLSSNGKCAISRREKKLKYVRTKLIRLSMFLQEKTASDDWRNWLSEFWENVSHCGNYIMESSIVSSKKIRFILFLLWIDTAIRITLFK